MHLNISAVEFDSIIKDIIKQALEVSKDSY